MGDTTPVLGGCIYRLFSTLFVRPLAVAKLNAAQLAPSADWIDDYRLFRDGSSDALDRHLAREQEGSTDD